MTKLGTLALAGSSGKDYDFNIYSINASFNAIPAVYAVTRRRKETGDDTWYHTTLYVGETENLEERFGSHHKANCFNKHNANCICVHGESSQKTRRTIEADLIKAKDPVCND